MIRLSSKTHRSRTILLSSMIHPSTTTHTSSKIHPSRTTLPPSQTPRMKATPRKSQTVLKAADHMLGGSVSDDLSDASSFDSCECAYGKRRSDQLAVKCG